MKLEGSLILTLSTQLGVGVCVAGVCTHTSFRSDHSASPSPFTHTPRPSTSLACASCSVSEPNSLLGVRNGNRTFQLLQNFWTLVGRVSFLPATHLSQLPSDFMLFVLLQHSTSVSIMGFSNTLEMEVSSTRLARTVEPSQIKAGSSLTTAPPQAIPSLLSGTPHSVPSLMSVQNHAMPGLTTSHLQTVPSLVRGTFQSMPNPMSESPQATASLRSDHSQTGSRLMSGHMQAVSSLASRPLQSVPPMPEKQPETGSSSSSSPGSGRPAGSLCPGDGADSSLVNALCKVSLGECHSTSPACHWVKGWPLKAESWP